MEVTRDKYELPLCVEESISALAKRCDTNVNNIFSSIHHGGRRFTRVPIEEVGDD